jgi:ATP/maltotriose-dependent transcriptional regulator MalT
MGKNAEKFKFFSRLDIYSVSVMTMSFLPFDTSATISVSESYHSSSSSSAAAGSAVLHIPREKLLIPAINDSIDRPRIRELLGLSATQFPATLVCGRSGTGKTVSVAAFASKRKGVAWNTLEPPDVHWASFANSTVAAIRGNGRSGPGKAKRGDLTADPEIKDVSRFVDSVFSAEGRRSKRLLVLDNVHYVFDTAWFREFFELLLPAIPEGAHVIFISRSKPSFPLWRMRSKQFLNVIDEKVFAFDEAETVELFKNNGFPVKLAPKAHQNCFGKVAQMLRFGQAAVNDQGSNIK